MAAILAGAALHAAFPLRLTGSHVTRWLLATPLLMGGIGLAGWALASAADADIEQDSELVTGGAYALTRNPMYLGWSAGVLGLAVGTGSAWLLAAWSVAVAALDREIAVEESRLQQRFGPAYAAYRARVPRYLRLRP